MKFLTYLFGFILLDLCESKLGTKNSISQMKFKDEYINKLHEENLRIPVRYHGQSASAKSANNMSVSSLTTTCFQDLGCISGDNFVFDSRPLSRGFWNRDQAEKHSQNLKFTNPDQINTTFNLFTRHNRNIPQVFNHKPDDSQINNSFFSANRKTKFIIHGFMAALNISDWIIEMKDYCLNHSDYNVIVVDWSKAALARYYYQAAADTRVVGAMLAHFVNRLVNATNALKWDMHCIGHSLGAHICGFAGQMLPTPKLSQIFGFDPAGPAFWVNNPNIRLDSSDAELVLVFHTGSGIFTKGGWHPIQLSGILGNRNLMGHIDFWPNGGSSQPGCEILQNILNVPLNRESVLKLLSCSHSRSQRYTISAPNSNCQFIGYKCDSYSNFKKGRCGYCGSDNTECKPMEFNLKFWENFIESKKRDTNEMSPTNYYLETSDSQPYCIFHYQILVQISKSSGSRAFGRLEILLPNNEKVSFPPSFKRFKDRIKINLMWIFRAGTNYTQLYVNKDELKPTNYLSVKWSSTLRTKLKVDKISINFMSHINKSERHHKSSHFCLNSGERLSNRKTVVFKKC